MSLQTFKRFHTHPRADIPARRVDHAHAIAQQPSPLQALADDLARTLFPKGSSEAKRLAVQANNNRHLILTGGRWKNDVVRWLVQRGF